MKIKRKAILLAAASKSDSAVSILEDLRAFRSFLRSNLGGGWGEEEIYFDENPTREKAIELIMASKNDDYSLVYFAGFGEIVKTDLPWPETQVQLSLNQTIREREMNSGSPRCTLILDCNRGPFRLPGTLLPAKEQDVFEQAKIKPEFRSMYDKGLELAEAGLARALAIGSIDPALNSISFTQYLLNETIIWASKNKGILHLDEAVELAKVSIKNDGSRQQPIYKGGRRLRHFPFAVQI